jgi:hypothetical protein
MSECNVLLETKKNDAVSKKQSASVASPTPQQLNDYQTAVNNLQDAVNACMDTGSLQTVGQQQLNNLAAQKTLKELKEDLDIARTRHEALMSGEKKVSDYQGVSGRLGFYKPLRESSVPVLISVGLFLIFAAVYAFSIMTRGPQALNSSAAAGAGFLADFDKRSFLYGVGVVGIVVGALAYFGVYGKGIN